VSGSPAIVRRILLRLEPGRGADGRLAAAARLAAAFHAELAARLVADTRVESAMAFAEAMLKTQHAHTTATAETIIRRAEATLRRSISSFAERERAAWSFEVVHCAGALTSSVVESEDLVAIELAQLETSLSDLREEVNSALAQARGVLLFPSANYPAKGPVVAIVPDDAKAKILTEVSGRIAAAVGEQLTVLIHGLAHDTAGFATMIRTRQAVLAIADASDPLVEEFLRRPRFLREIAAPLLLLKSETMT